MTRHQRPRIRLPLLPLALLVTATAVLHLNLHRLNVLLVIGALLLTCAGLTLALTEDA